MKPFIEFVSILNEAAVSRFVGKLDNHAIGIITGWRSCRTKDDNRKRNIALAKELTSTGFQYYKSKGRFIENYGSKGNERPVDEESFIVFGAKPDPIEDKRLRVELERLGRKYNQDAILFKDVKKDAILIRTQEFDSDCNIGTPIDEPYEKSIGKLKFKPDVMQTIMKGKIFSFSID